jgi:methylated-DNA-[protein]-cysteine S-methyltransferase
VSERGFVFFDTAIGRCAVAWTERGLAGVQLPEARESDTRARIQRRVRGAAEAEPPPDVRKAIEGIMALLAGNLDDLSYIELDVHGLPEFNRRVYEVARTIAPGHTLTYGEIAVRCGHAGDARAVGQALGRNPYPIVVPCHRVLAANGRLGGFSAHGGVTTKLRLLEIEGARMTMFATSSGPGP